MRKLQQYTEGFTLLEILVAMAILSILFTIILLTTFQGARVQSSTERRVGLDSSLRRTTQIITQDLRNAVYGMLTSTPYASDVDSFSVTQAADTASQSVAGPPVAFQSSSSLSVLAQAGFSWPTSTYFILVNPALAQPNATIFSTNSPSVGAGLVVLNHVGANTICYSTSNLVQKVNLIGYELNPSQKILYRRVVNEFGNDVSPVAFGVSGFSIAYIAANGTTYTSLSAIPSSSQLVRLTVNITMERPNGLGVESRSLNSTVEVPKIFTLSSNPVKYIEPGTTQACP